MKQQQGFTTLIVSLIMVLLVTLNVIIGSKSANLEIKSANNIYRTEAAFENAEQGVRTMLSTLSASLAANPSTKLTNTTLTSNSKYTSYFCNAVDSNCAETDTLKFPYVKSVGVDPSGATRTVSQRLTYNYTPATPPLISTPITDALTALGNISIGGNANIDSAKSGGSISTSGSGSVGTQDSSDFYQKNIVNGVSTYLQAANGSKIKWTSDEFFMNYFGGLCPTTVTGYKALQALTTVTSVALAQQAALCKPEVLTTIQSRSDGYVCGSGCNNADLSAQYTAGKRIMWLTQGGMKINSNVTLGSVSDPVLIFVMNGGSVQINGTSKIYGVVYVDVPDVSYTVTNVSGTTTCNCTGTSYITATSGNGNNKTFTWSSVSFAPTTTTQWCTVQACLNASSKCTPSYTTTNQSKVNDTSTCNYNISVDVGDQITNPQTQVVIEVLGTWDNSGGGNALIEGAAITSGNYSTTGGINIVKDTGAVNKFQLGTPGTNTLTTSTSGWSDMN
ncbi:hypothetical protein [Vogesella sp. LIG4]|uniref:pilus assembly PilX family protein n=1 Tax=Vogesella sp. LIG4 TaxID=1192162 RepID=UPI00081F7BF3|nr:hypothetical protein [Vogesella sp. LIG4]SCK18842.1 hypothetical protein PSELUDRAFT_2049 [Vogesella sp. LIG4]